MVGVEVGACVRGLEVGACVRGLEVGAGLCLPAAARAARVRCLAVNRASLNSASICADVRCDENGLPGLG